jgi:hypothetical protein
MNIKSGFLFLCWLTSSAAWAVVPIQPGQPYTLKGFLAIRFGSSSAGTEDLRPHAWLVAQADDPKWSQLGTQDVELLPGGISDNLLTLARRFGPSQAVAVTGVGNESGGLQVSRITASDSVAAVTPRRVMIASATLEGNSIALQVQTDPTFQHGDLRVKTQEKAGSSGGTQSLWLEDRRPANAAEFKVSVMLRFDLTEFFKRSPVNLTVESGDGTCHKLVWTRQSN